MKRSSGIFCGLLLASAAQAGQRAEYAFQWPLQLTTASGAYCIVLTPEVYAALKGAGLQDLEVFNSAGESVGFGPLPSSMTTSFGDFGQENADAWEYTQARSTGAGSGSEFTYSIAGPLPVERVRVDLGSDNALAELSVLARDPGQGWRLVAGVTAYSLSVENTTLERNSIAFAATREREWLLRSAQPLARAPRLELGFRPDQFLFLAQGAPPFTLAAGSLTARRADYPSAQLLQTLRSEFGRNWQPPLATLGPRSAVQGQVAIAAPPAPAKSYKVWVLWIVLLLGAALVIGMVVKLLREKPP